MIFGPDSRTIVPNPAAALPTRAAVQLEVLFPSGHTIGASGTLIGPNDVLAAGHSVYEPQFGGPAVSITITPARSGNSAPFGTFKAKAIAPDPEWLLEAGPVFQLGPLDHDIAVVTLDRDASHIGSLPVAVLGGDVTGTSIESTGYPFDLGQSVIPYRGVGTLTTSTDFVLRSTTFDTFLGQSGAGVLAIVNGVQSVVGVISHDTETYNGSTRINPEKLTAINQWRSTNDETAGPDLIIGGIWGETWSGLAGNDTVTAMDGNDTVFGGPGDDDVNGNRGEDSVYGDGGADFARGGQENDNVYGGAGDDWHVNGNIGADIVYGDGDGAIGHDTIFGGQGDDLLIGDNFAFGAGGNDLLIGNFGNDTLVGDPGNDTLRGDAGRDRFWLYSGDGNDVIEDFAAGDELIALEPNINGIGYVAGSPFSMIQARIVSDGQGGSMVDLGAGNSVRLIGISPSLLNADNFVLLF